MVNRSLGNAIETLRGECVAALASEYPDQRIELRSLPVAGAPSLHCWYVDGTPFGAPVNLEDVVGHALCGGREPAVRALVEAASEKLMLYLQTAA